MKRFLLILFLITMPMYGGAVPISDLPSATTPLTGTEVVPLVQSSTTKKARVSDFTTPASSNTFINIMQSPYSATCDGSTDDSAAFQAALTANLGPIFVPWTTTGCVVGDVTLVTGNSIVGEAGPRYATISTKPKITAKTGATNIFNVNGLRAIYIAGVALDGNSRATNCISGGAGSITVENTHFLNCNYSIGDSAHHYTQGLYSKHNVFYGGNFALTDFLDSHSTDDNFAAIQGAGVLFSAGSNDNQIENCKVEFVTGNGITVSDSFHNKVNCIYDRAYKNGISVLGTSDYNTFSGVMRRNGYNDVSGQNAHIRLESSGAHNVFTGITTRVGVNDDSSGPTTPAYSVWVNSASVVPLITGSNLLGAVTSPFFFNATPTNMVTVNNIGINDKTYGQNINYTDDGRSYYSGSGNITTANSGNDVVTGLRATSTFSRNRATLQLTFRNATSGATYAGNFNLVFVREATTCSVSASAIIGEVGSAGVIQFGAGTLSLSTSAVDNDCSGFTLTTANTTGATVGRRIWVRE